MSKPSIIGGVNVSGYMTNNEKNITTYRRSPSGAEGYVTIKGKVPGPNRQVILRGFNRQQFARNVTIGFDSAVGSLFEDEALILPDPHLPIRLKDEGYASKNDSKNSSTKIWNIMKYGGAYTSLRLNVTGIDNILPPGNKGNDIEIDYTLIIVDESNAHKDIVILGEFKKGKGATGTGDAVQLNRAAQAVSWHFKNVHGRIPEIRAYFVAGGALDLQDIQFFAKANKMSSDISSFSKTNSPKPFTIRLTNAEGWGRLIGLDIERIRRILRIPLTEITKFNDALWKVETLFIGDASLASVTVKNLVNSGFVSNPPALWKSNVTGNRVSRLKEVDIIPSFVWKKRDLEKIILSNSTSNTNRDVAFRHWLGLVQKLSTMDGLSEDARKKYKNLANLYPGQTGLAPAAPTLIDKIILRRRYLKTVYKLNPESSSNFMNHTNLLTMAGYLKFRNAELTKIIRNNSLSKNNKFKKLVIWNEMFHMGRTVNAQTKSSRMYQLILNKYRNALAAVSSTATLPTYNSLINEASNEQTLKNIYKLLSVNNRYNFPKKIAISNKIKNKRKELELHRRINAATTRNNVTQIEREINANTQLPGNIKVKLFTATGKRKTNITLAGIRGRRTQRSVSPAKARVTGQKRSVSRSRSRAPPLTRSPNSMNKNDLESWLTRAKINYNPKAPVANLRTLVRQAGRV